MDTNTSSIRELSDTIESTVAPENKELSKAEPKENELEVYKAASARATHYLHSRNPFWSKSAAGDTIQDNFSQMLILELTGNPMFTTYKQPPSGLTWNYFIEPPADQIQPFPNDVDTTAVAHIALETEYSVVKPVLDAVAGNRDDKTGIVRVYFDDQRVRFDAVVACNVLRLFNTHAEGNRAGLMETENFVIETLKERTFLQGTRYYGSPECFLYFCLRLAQSMDSARRFETVQSILSELRLAIMELLEVETKDPLKVAMRILTLQGLGIGGVVEEKGLMRKLLELQRDDGGWDAGDGLCRNGKSGVGIGNEGVNTAFAVQALKNAVAVEKD